MCAHRTPNSSWTNISISERTLPFQNGWVISRTFQIFRKEKTAPNSKLLSSDYQYIRPEITAIFHSFLNAFLCTLFYYTL